MYHDSLIFDTGHDTFIRDVLISLVFELIIYKQKKICFVRLFHTQTKCNIIFIQVCHDSLTRDMTHSYVMCPASVVLTYTKYCTYMCMCVNFSFFFSLSLSLSRSLSLCLSRYDVNMKSCGSFSRLFVHFFVSLARVSLFCLSLFRSLSLCPSRYDVTMWLCMSLPRSMSL